MTRVRNLLAQQVLSATRMADGIYLGMNGAAARAAQLDAVSDNLANAQTPGFQAELPAFQAFLPSGGSRDKAYVASVGAGVDTRPGTMINTGVPTDVAPRNGSYLVVQLGQGVAYTRDGRLQVDAEGTVRAAGHPVLDASGGPITAPPNAKVHINSVGQVLADGNVIGTLSTARIDGPIARAAPSLITTEPGTTVTPTTDGVDVGQIESSNASPLQAAIELVSVQRHYETSLQAIQTYRRMDERATELGKVR